MEFFSISPGTDLSIFTSAYEKESKSKHQKEESNWKSTKGQKVQSELNIHEAFS